MENVLKIVAGKIRIIKKKILKPKSEKPSKFTLLRKKKK